MPTSDDRAIDNLVSRLRFKTKSKLDVELPVSTIYGGGYLLND
jgi:DNA-binding response OmpR family regulator